MNFRVASPSDASAMLDIYAPFVSDTSLTFELELPTVTAFAERIGNYLQRWPWLLAEENDRVAGYAYASQHRERAGYQWSVECSVYMHPDFQGTGVAKKLYQLLFNILKELGYRNVYAVINLPNDRSVAFHERLGFVYQFTFENVGYKLGRWKNVGWWMLQLNEYSEHPDPVKKFNSQIVQF